MPVTTAADLVNTLRQSRLCEPALLEEIAQTLQSRFSEARTLARELIARGWLTPYQVNQLLKGCGHELVLGAYVLLERLGEGGMGQVFKAQHRMLDRIVALKIVRKDRVANADSIRRFHREIHAAAQLSHPNIVHAFDAGQAGETHFFVMEYVEGIDLNRLVKERGPLPVAEACDYVRHAALGLQHAHERGLVHRDIKPANLLLARGQGSMARKDAEHQLTLDERLLVTVKVLDMGLARLTATEASLETKELTQTGVVMGTADYMAPEQAEDSHRADIRADIYSLGCTLYFLLTGRVPFPGGTFMHKVFRHRMEEPVPIEKLRPDLTAGLIVLVRKMMAKRPADRYQLPAEVVAAIDALDERSQQTIPAGATAVPAVRRPTAGTAVPHDPFGELWSDSSSKKTPARPMRHRTQWPWLVGGGITFTLLLAGFLLLLSRQASRTKPETKSEEAEPTKSKREPTAKELAALEEKKRRKEEEETERKRRTDADEALKPLVTKAADAKTTFADLAKDVAAFKGKYGGTPAAIKAAELLMKLPSPLDQLDPKKLPQDCIDYWRAAGRERPGELVGVLGEHRWTGDGSFGAYGPAVSPDGTMLAVGGEARMLVLDTRTGHAIKALPGPGFLQQFSPDGKTLACLWWPSNDIKLYDVQSGKLCTTLKGHTGQVWSFAFTPDSKTLASAGEDGNIRLWDLDAGKERRTLPASPFLFAQICAWRFREMERLWQAGSRKMPSSYRSQIGSRNKDIDAS